MTSCSRHRWPSFTFSATLGDSGTLSFLSGTSESCTWLLAGGEEKPSGSLASWHTSRRSVFFLGQVELKKKSPLVLHQQDLLSANPPTRMGRKSKYLFYKWINLVPSSKESLSINYHNFSILRYHWFEDIFILNNSFLKKKREQNKYMMMSIVRYVLSFLKNISLYQWNKNIYSLIFIFFFWLWCCQKKKIL